MNSTETIIALRDAIHEDDPQLVPMFEAIESWYGDMRNDGGDLIDAIADTLEGCNPYCKNFKG